MEHIAGKSRLVEPLPSGGGAMIAHDGQSANGGERIPCPTMERTANLGARRKKCRVRQTDGAPREIAEVMTQVNATHTKDHGKPHRMSI